ncbi:hydrogenase 2 accessory protein HypG [Haemophilus influenzae]|nr:hydrogenase 2 accessory protein HypG [Haemophilus influenzae]PRJ58630.1 hydrogenase 2 accessory protein HypG [Haemophilus influenzae]PRJ59011.1 hydrogenase 2 accessory protein HypG [Haemophilus influenzae]PRL98310.1 hydrogenase 2 accessory protein HypG [Haemophilus influenzae]
MSVIDEDEAKKTQEALITMSQLKHEVGDFLGLNQK